MEGYRCETCNCSMSESAYIENQGMCSKCFDGFLKDQIEFAKLERAGVFEGLHNEND